MSPDEHLVPLEVPRGGRARVRALIDLCRSLATRINGAPLPRPTQWSGIVATAERYRLTPALFEALRHADTLRVLDADLAERLRAEYAANVVTNATLARQLRECLGALNRHGIEPVVLKGALALIEGPTPSARMMTDLDVLVAGERMDDACDALGSIGYTILPGPGAAARFECSASRADLAAPIDLHRALGVGAVAEALATSHLLARATARQVDAVRYLALAPADQLAHAVVHPQCNDKAHRTGAISLRQLHNFALLYADLGDPAAWNAAVRRLHAVGLGSVVGAHAELQRHLFGLELAVPPSTFRTKAHVARCLATYAIPHLSDIETNALLAFEAPTMAARYPNTATASARLRHAFATARQGGRALRNEALRPRNH